MVTSKFEENFTKEKASHDDIIRYQEDNIIEDLEETVVDTFHLNLEEAIDFAVKFDNFKQEGSRSEITETRKTTAKKYKENYGLETTKQIANNLRVPQKQFSLGLDIWNFLRQPEADILAEDAEEEINQILEADSQAIEQEIEEKLHDEYKEAAEEAYQNVEEDITEIAGLSKITNNQPELETFDTLQWVKEKQENPNWQEEIDTKEITKRLKSEVETQKRSKTLDALKNQAEKIVAEEYKEITGQEPESIGKDELYAIRAVRMTEDPEDIEVLEDIIRHNDEVYFRDSSPSSEELGSLENSEVEVLKNGLGRETYQIEGREFEVFVASPTEALRYGDEFRTCHSVTWEETSYGGNKEIIRNSAGLKKPIIYVEDENGNVVGRDRMDLDREDELHGKTVKTLEGGRIYGCLESQQANSELRDAIEDYQERMRTELGYINNQERSDISDAIIRNNIHEEWHAPEYELKT